MQQPGVACFHKGMHNIHPPILSIPPAKLTKHIKCSWQGFYFVNLSLYVMPAMLDWAHIGAVQWPIKYFRQICLDPGLCMVGCVSDCYPAER